MTPEDGEPLLIVGASARAAAESARRGGFRPYAIDLFADADLAEVAEVRLSRNFPYDIPALARTVPACDWLYVGGLENYPDVVDALSAERRLLGNSGEVLKTVRDPRALRDLMCRHGESFPETIFDRSELPRPGADPSQPTTDGDRTTEPTRLEGRWLMKRRRSSAGLGVFELGSDSSASALDDAWPADGYLQRHIEGLPIGAVYLAAPHGAYLLGVSNQLTCPSDDGKQPFRYAGSVGPEPLSNLAAMGLDDKLAKIGILVTSGFRLSGIFSCDFILDKMRTPWLLEINPRYTASVELLERSGGGTANKTSYIARHVAACRSGPGGMSLGDPLALYPTGSASHGKRIVYARRTIEHVPERFTDELLRLGSEEARRGAWPTVADIPRAGSSIRRDEPLATVFAEARTQYAVYSELDRREQELHAILDRLSC